MKKKIMLLLMVSIMIILMVTIVSGYNNSAPNFDCIQCHQPIGEYSSKVILKGLPKNYEPGKVYKLELSVVSSLKSLGEVQGGFAAEVTAGELIVNDKIKTQLSNGILTHTQKGTHFRKWTFAWKAPMTKKDAELKVMVVASNGDFSPVDDDTVADVFITKPKK